jgi:hypothetical protein
MYILVVDLKTCDILNRNGELVIVNSFRKLVNALALNSSRACYVYTVMAIYRVVTLYANTSS